MILLCNFGMYESGIYLTDKPVALCSNQFGVGQRIPKGGGDIESKTVEYVDKSVKYMQRVWREEEFSRVRHKCRNQHEVSLQCT